MAVSTAPSAWRTLAADAVVMVDAHGQIERLNDSFVRLMGRPASALLGRAWSQLAEEAGLRVRDGQGGEFMLSVRRRPLVRGSGEEIGGEEGGAVITFDTPPPPETPLARCDNGEGWVMAVLAAAGEAVLLLDDAATIVAANTVARTRLASEALEGQSVLSLLDGVAPARARRLWPRLVARGFRGVTLPLVRKGSEPWVAELRLCPLNQPLEGAADAVVALLIRDPGAREQLVRAQHHARRVAERQSKAKSEFLANMSHELRTPLNAVLGFSEVMEAEMFGPMANPRYSEYVRNIRESARHLLDVISDVLDLSKVESGTLTLTREWVDLEQVLETALRFMRPRAEAGRVRLDSPERLDLPRVWGDELRLKQVLLNLLSNAVKFTPAGGCVAVDAQVLPETLVLGVHDTGVGMTEEEAETALSPYGQVHDPLISAQEGTGLGLPLSRRLVELHGGTLIVESRKGGGTSVVVNLPLERIAPNRVHSVDRIGCVNPL